MIVAESNPLNILLAPNCARSSCKTLAHIAELYRHSFNEFYFSDHKCLKQFVQRLWKDFRNDLLCLWLVSLTWTLGSNVKLNRFQFYYLCFFIVPGHNRTSSLDRYYTEHKPRSSSDSVRYSKTTRISKTCS